MNELEIQMQKLRDTALTLKTRIHEAYQLQGIEIDSRGIPRLLEAIAEDMMKKEISKKRLESHAFGIFRIITDGWIFEDTTIGKELMEFRLELRKLASKIQNIDESKN